MVGLAKGKSAPVRPRLRPFLSARVGIPLVETEKTRPHPRQRPRPRRSRENTALRHIFILREDFLSLLIALTYMYMCKIMNEMK